jgi:hypothetical protein
MRRPTSIVFSIHVAITLVAAIAVVVLNLLTDRDQFWAIWPIWGLLMLLGAHTGLAALPRHRLLGLWLGFGLVLILGLVVIDLGQPGTAWWFWPAGAWIALSALFIALDVDLLAHIPEQDTPPGERDDGPIDNRRIAP